MKHRLITALVNYWDSLNSNEFFPFISGYNEPLTQTV